MPRYNIDLFNTDSFQNALKGVREYQESLDDKCYLLCQRLLSLGLKSAQSRIDESPYNKLVVLSSEITREQSGCDAVLLAVGEVKDVPNREPFSVLMAIEFGAGIYYNRGAKNPYADDLGFGVGTYPDQIHAFEDGWYYWDETENKWMHTHGIKATMPMYNALSEMYDNAERIVREVFKNG